MDDKKQSRLAIIAIVLLIVAAALFFWNYRASQPDMVKITPQDIEKEIQRIQHDPNMPPQAKEIAIQQLRTRSGTPSQPQTGPR
jgi:nitrogen fixation-related uncharacterized protein